MIELSPRHRDFLICMCLVLVTAAVYWPVQRFGFVYFDDPGYIYENPHLREGLTLRGVGWAFTTGLDQWMPVTWLARLAEHQFFGLDAGAHHLVNVLFHIANAVLLFGVFKRMTAAPWRSAMVAGLFALHPLHVQSVAWVTGLKDVLSMFFGLLTIWAYVRYVGRDALRRVHGWPRSSAALPPMDYALTLLFFALALMAKPMMVTLPFVLLLLDYWPLGRIHGRQVASGTGHGIPLTRLLWEKLPFFVLAAASCYATYWAQRSQGAVVPLAKVALATRLANVPLAYIGYIVKTVWPAGLSFFYPLPPALPATTVAAACALLVGVTVAVIWRARREPWLATGWFWYLGTLVPVIGLVQVGFPQAMADRYTYFPLTGLFILVCWSIPWRARQPWTSKAITGVVAVAVLAACAVVSGVQVGYWKDSHTLYGHGLRVNPNNWLAYNNLASVLGDEGRYAEAVQLCEKAVRIKPDFGGAYYNLAYALSRLGKTREAIEQYRKAIQVYPDYSQAYHNLGIVLLREGDVPAAIEAAEHAVQYKPEIAEAHYSLAIALNRAGRTQEAMNEFAEAVRLKPDFAEAQYSLANALMQTGRREEAIRHFELALKSKPDYPEAHNNLGNALLQQGRLTEAVAQYDLALRYRPDYAEVHANLGNALFRAGRVQEAIGQYQQALHAGLDSAGLHYNLGTALEQAGRVQEAIGQYERAVRLDPGFAPAQIALARLRGGK